MPIIITENIIKSWIKDESNNNIEFACMNCAEGIKYDFRLGTKFLKSHFGRMADFNTLSSDEKRHAIIKPGEVVFVLTEERLNLPDNIFVQLSPKRKLSHLGIQILGGLTIDPGYTGHLIFGLCNLSSTDFTLEPNKKLVGAVFYELSKEEVIKYNIPNPTDEFPDEMLTLIKQYKPVESSFLSEEIKRISEEVSRISRDLTTDNEWKKTFKDSLDSVKDNISEISSALKVEVEVRQKGEEFLKVNDDRLNNSITSINENITSFKAWTKTRTKIMIALLTLAATGGIALLVDYISKTFFK